MGARAGLDGFGKEKKYPVILSLFQHRTVHPAQLAQVLKLLICTRKIPSSEPDRTLTTPVSFSVIFPTRK